MTNGLREHLSYPSRAQRNISIASRIICYLTSHSNVLWRQYFTATVFYSKRVIKSKRFPVSYWVVTLSSCLAMTLTSMEAAEAANTRSLGGAKHSQVIQVSGAKTAHWIRAVSMTQPGMVIILTSPPHGWGSSDAVAQCSCRTQCHWSLGTLSPHSHPSSTKTELRNKEEQNVTSVALKTEGRANEICVLTAYTERGLDVFITRILAHVMLY